jgi:hypothetical protein
LLSPKINLTPESNFNKSEKTSATEEELVKHVWQDEAFDMSSNHVIVRERVIKLPETHIFTPIKSISPVAVSKDISDEVKSEKTSIYVKEYHDVEYSLEPKFKSEPIESDFNEFQSAVLNDDSPEIAAAAATTFAKIDSIKPQPPLDILMPQSAEVLKPKPAEILQPQSVFPKTQASADLLMPQKVNYSSAQNGLIEKMTTIATPADDFDFAEFQAAPCISQTTTPPKEKEKPNSITLSPMHLVNSYKASEAKSDNKMIYLSNATAHSSGIQETNCDDDWSDFVSSNIDANSKSSSSGGECPWSDFVSGPMKPSITNSSSSQFPSKPNFSSWNQPVSRPYAVNHTTSFLSSYQPTDMGERKAANKPMNITNNFNYGVDQSAKNFQHGVSNGISTILPDLQFAIPNNMINLSRANTTTSNSAGKK